MMKKKKPTEEAKVDVTPLLDIVFIMLIFFIVSSTFIRESGLDVSEEKNSENLEDTNNAKIIAVHICSNQTVVVDRRLIDVRAVRANIERKLVDENAAVVTIESEPGAPTDSLVKVIDQTKAAKAKFTLVQTGTSCQQALA